jgi:prepilin-type N-terminal cleavage/methylation domain-containing protein
MKRISSHAFSLVELSIVLVILGLLVGGVLSGQSLIRAAELRSVTTDYQRYTAATVAFRDKYMALPGDMLNATKFWSMAPGAANYAQCAALATASTSKATCNGDGDGRIDYQNTDDAPHESARLWQHLANAGLIEGSYSGIETNANKPSINYPASKISNGVWAMWSLRGRAVWNWAPKDPGEYIAFGRAAGSPLNWHNAILKPEEAWSIDKKIDDGLPFIGKATDMMKTGPTDYTPNCTIDETDESTEYKLAENSIACLLVISVF